MQDFFEFIWKYTSISSIFMMIYVILMFVVIYISVKNIRKSINDQNFRKEKLAILYNRGTEYFKTLQVIEDRKNIELARWSDRGVTISDSEYRRTVTDIEIDEFSSKKSENTSIVFDFIQQSPSILTTLGILGTFIGLTIMFVQMTHSMHINFDVKGITTFQNIISTEQAIGISLSLGFSFATSVIGIVGSLLITFFLSRESKMYTSGSIWSESDRRNIRIRNNNDMHLIDNIRLIVKGMEDINTLVDPVHNLLGATEKSLSEAKKNLSAVYDADGRVLYPGVTEDDVKIKNILDSFRLAHEVIAKLRASIMPFYSKIS